MNETNNLEWLNREEYPFEHHYFETTAGKMHYVDEGNGTPIVFVHGNPSWSFEFRKIIKQFSSNNRCIAPDHIGFGLSDKPFSWTYLPEDQADNFEQFINSLNLDNITLVVGDWGGPIGLSYVINHPDKIKNIVITNTWMWSAKTDWYYIAFSGFMGGPIGRWLIRNYNFFANNVVKQIFGVKSRLTPEVHEHLLKPLAKPEDRKGCWTFPKHIIASSDWLAGLWDKREVLKSMNIVIAWGMKDIAFREKELKVWLNEFPDAKVVRYADAGHFVAEEKPDELIAELEEMLKV